MSPFYTAIDSSIRRIDAALGILSFLDQSMDDNSCLYVSCVPHEVFHDTALMSSLEEYAIAVFASFGIRGVPSRHEEAQYCVDWCGSRHRTYNVPHHIAFRLEQQEVVPCTMIPPYSVRPWKYRILSYDDMKPQGSCIRYETYQVATAFNDAIESQVELETYKINAYLYTGLA